MWYRIKIRGLLPLTFDVKATLRLIWNKNKKGEREKKKKKTRNRFAPQFPRPFCRLAGNSYHGRCDYFAACRGLINVKSNIGGSRLRSPPPCHAFCRPNDSVLVEIPRNRYLWLFSSICFGLLFTKHLDVALSSCFFVSRLVSFLVIGCWLSCALH